MRKRMISSKQGQPPLLDRGSLHLEDIAVIELTSEDAAHPIEGALLPGAASGWRAEQPGEQTIRVIFDQPQRLKSIWLHFEESEIARTQEFVLRYSSDGGHSLQEIVRQQWNF